VTIGAFSIRVAEVGDADRMVEVSLAARGVAGADPRDAIADANRLVLVAEVNDEIVGWAKTHHYRGASGSAPGGHYLGGVNVHPDFRRRGIGAALTRARLGWIWDRAPDAWFETNARNAASIALHAQFGFTEVIRAGEFHGTTFEGGVGILFRATALEGEPVGGCEGDNDECIEEDAGNQRARNERAQNDTDHSESPVPARWVDAWPDGEPEPDVRRDN
jgi:aminoglycoside 6'-N-acetyltransferase I